MNDVFFRYKSRFITIALLLSYTFLHMRLTGIYVEATFEQFLNFSARLPFGQRLLVPTIAHYLSLFLALQPSEAFFLLEWGFISLFYLALLYLLRLEFSEKQATLLSWLFILVLPIVMVINYRWIANGQAPLFFPNDTSSLFFMAAGMLFCLQERWLYFILLLFIATFNRESSILLVFLIPLLHWSRLRAVIAPLGLAIVTFLVGRLLVIVMVHNLPGSFFEFYFFQTEHTNFEVNLLRLLEGQQLFFFLYCLAGLPLFWFAFYDYIPSRYQPLRYLVLAYFLGLLMVGNFTEARIFGEIIVLMYVPVCAAIQRWLSGVTHQSCSTSKGLLFYCNRYAVLTILFLVLLLKLPLNQGIIWLSHSL